MGEDTKNGKPFALSFGSHERPLEKMKSNEITVSKIRTLVKTQGWVAL